ncbi:folate family ECF transporter S component [Sporolactobacillus shoreicorticis]|uniref:Folate family ECF transporter S component n=1 Tax=Sporolactobacillus shoreicorticis TaxID=1923877 RepID=A0ABW5S2F8_9BACL|nr:folate family ECF transporter S component [Sporolactobacillus shoreicorticis]MCO7126441.1 folate family ECF transporter S component [Sporolactobacillus shoreicorticis]
MAIHSSIFSAAYWKTAAAELRKLNRLTLAALIIALTVVIGSFTIPVTENLHISFNFLIVAFGSMVYGPLLGIFAGAAMDIVGYIAHPFGAFFPGYTLSSMLGCFIYGLFLYHRRISVMRIFLAKLIVNFVINVGLGCLWSQMLFGKGYWFFLINSLIKNALMLPIETIMLTVLLQALMPVLTRAHVIPVQNGNRISLI